MSMWTSLPDLAYLNAMRKNTICEVLDITFDAFDDNSITASMVVDHRTHQQQVSHIGFGYAARLAAAI